MKFFLWCAFILLVVLALRKKLRLWLQHQKNQRRTDIPTQTQVEMRAKHPEAMLACAHCGMYIPVSEAIRHTDLDTHNDVVFCSTAHRQQYFSS